jgi:hypothetical protein
MREVQFRSNKDAQDEAKYFLRQQENLGLLWVSDADVNFQDKEA